MGSQAYHVAALLQYGADDCILEIGAQRGEGSTAFLAQIAIEVDVPLYSIDPDPRRREEYPAGGTLITGKAEDVLAHWDREHPRFTYADGADWPYSWNLDKPKEMAEYNDLYSQWGGELSQQYSARAHLAAANQLHRLSRPGDIVLFDDTWSHQDLGVWIGKGMTAVPLLLLYGWRLVQYVSGIEPEDGYVELER